MRARRAAEVGTLDDQAVLGKDPAVDADLQRHERNRSRDRHTDAQLLSGGCGGWQERCDSDQRDHRTAPPRSVAPAPLAVVPAPLSVVPAQAGTQYPRATVV